MTLALAVLFFLQESLLDQGRRFLEERNPAAAEKVFRELAARDPDDSRASYYLGIALARQDRNEEAIEPLENARRAAKRPNASVLYELGTALGKLERWREAEEFLRQATELAPAEALFRLQLGWAYYSMLEGEKARTEFERVIASAPSAMAYFYLGLTDIGLGESEAAVEALRAAVRMDPGLAEARVALGKVLARAGRDEEAEPVLLRALELPGIHAEAHFQLGLIAIRRGELDSALRSFEAAVDSDPGHLQAWYNRALALERLGRGDEARAAWARVAELRASGAEDPEASSRRMRARTR